MSEIPHGLYVLQLRDRVVNLASVDPPPGTKVTSLHAFTSRDDACDFLFNQCGADPTFLYKDIRDDEYLPAPTSSPQADYLTPAIPVHSESATSERLDGQKAALRGDTYEHSVAEMQLPGAPPLEALTHDVQHNARLAQVADRIAQHNDESPAEVVPPPTIG